MGWRLVPMFGLAVSRSAAFNRRRSTPQPIAPSIEFSVESSVELPLDSSAAITSSGLLGGKYLALVPGAEDLMLENGDEVTLTQSSVNLGGPYRATDL